MKVASILFPLRGKCEIRENVLINAENFSMIDVANQWNPKQALLKDILRKPDMFNEAIDLCLNMHSIVHTSEVSGTYLDSFEDLLWTGLEDCHVRIMPSIKDVTIAWNIWHITRIEDLISNILIADDSQVIHSDDWLDKMEVNVCDTGNIMSDDEILSFSKNINIKELRKYRIAVGKRTREILRRLQQYDIKRKVEPDRIKRIYSEGGVLEGSKGLLDFWGRKDIGGLLQMPITRHQIVHLNDSFKIKQKLLKNKK